MLFQTLIHAKTIALEPGAFWQKAESSYKPVAGAYENVSATGEFLASAHHENPSESIWHYLHASKQFKANMNISNQKKGKEASSRSGEKPSHV